MPSPGTIPNFRAELSGAIPIFRAGLSGSLRGHSGMPGYFFSAVHCWRTAANPRKQRMRRTATWKSLLFQIPSWQIGWTPVRWTSWTSTMQWPLGLAVFLSPHVSTCFDISIKKYFSPWVPHRLIILLTLYVYGILQTGICPSSYS